MEEPECNEGEVHGRLNASWKISCLAVNGQSFLVIDGYLLSSLSLHRIDRSLPVISKEKKEKERRKMKEKNTEISLVIQKMKKNLFSKL